MNDSSLFLTVPKGKIHYNASPNIFDEEFDSNKPLVIFLHGANKKSQNTEYWNPIIDSIKKYCNPIRIDLLGYGSSKINQKLDDIADQDQVESVEIIINHILNKTNFKNISVIGRSYGAFIAQKLASNNPTIKKLGLIAPVCQEEGKPILTNWNKPVTILWDVMDPIISFSEIKYLKSTKNKINLFILGNTQSEYCLKKLDYFKIPNYKPTHSPEILVPSFFEEFLSYFCNL